MSKLAVGPKLLARPAGRGPWGASGGGGGMPAGPPVNGPKTAGPVSLVWPYEDGRRLELTAPPPRRLRPSPSRAARAVEWGHITPTVLMEVVPRRSGRDRSGRVSQCHPGPRRDAIVRRRPRRHGVRGHAAPLGRGPYHRAEATPRQDQVQWLCAIAAGWGSAPQGSRRCRRLHRWVLLTQREGRGCSRPQRRSTTTMSIVTQRTKM